MLLAPAFRSDAHVKATARKDDHLPSGQTEFKAALDSIHLKGVTTVPKEYPSWITAASRELVLLAPADSAPAFGRPCHDEAEYDHLLHDMQRLRGSVYLADGAIRHSDLSVDGRHVSAMDEKAWHVLTLDGGGRVRGCSRYLAHDRDARFSDLVIRNSALARDPYWGKCLRLSVESDMALARQRGIDYVEVGGWALDTAARSTTEALRIALATYALSRRLGGCIGISTATVRHCSATILQKIGGTVLQFAGSALPLYFDPAYRCEMAMLRFESEAPNPRYDSWIEGLRAQLRNISVVCKSSAAPWRSLPATRWVACA